MPKDSPLKKGWPSRATWPSVIFLMLVIFVSASYTFAHKVVLFAYGEGDKVFTESYFSDGKRCQDSRIEVFDSLGNKLLEGKTDNNGEFSFNPPKKTDLRIVLTASMGHKDEYTIPAGALGGEAGGSSPGSESHKAVKKVFDFRPRKIIEQLDLMRPQYLDTACYGHFGREDKKFKWEETDRVSQLKGEVN